LRVEALNIDLNLKVLGGKDDRLDTAKNAPPVVEKRKRDKVEQRVKLELPLRQEQELQRLEGEG
jgi:hypothetical protein